ncbi:hypothetical protein [Pantoea agglomerans]|uniref:hypothetical protein n=1 Tax=Enterobacter agglomerans TaxID=549 RepID=UPI0039659ADE
MSKRVLVRHYTGNAIKFILPALMFMMLILPHLCFAGTLISALDVKGTTGTAYWSTQNTSSHYDKVSSISIKNSSNGSWLPTSGLGIVNNCSFTFTTEEGKIDNIVASLNGIDAMTIYHFPEPVNIVSYSMSCRATLTNESQSNIVMDGHYVFYVNFHPDNGSILVVNAQISKGTLYTSPSCTLSVPDTAINFMGDAASFISGIRRSASFSATCEGTSSATLTIVGSGAIDTEGCLAAQKKGDFSQALRLCADGFKLDGSNSKALRMDDSGNSTGSIDFTLSSYNNEEPQPGDYTTTVYAVIAPD